MTPEQHLQRVRERGELRARKSAYLAAINAELAACLKEASAAGLPLRVLAEASGLSYEGVRQVILKGARSGGETI
jgi:hypothetical protein